MGEYVYEEDFRDPISPDFFEHEIVAVDIDNRKLITKDHSVGGEAKTLRGFWTVDELVKRGITINRKKR